MLSILFIIGGKQVINSIEDNGVAWKFQLRSYSDSCKHYFHLLSGTINPQSLKKRVLIVKSMGFIEMGSRISDAPDLICEY